MSDANQTPQRKQDLVFNDQTCRALRREGHDAVRLLVPAATLLLFFFAAVILSYLPIESFWLDAAIGMAFSAGFAVAVVAEVRWFGISFYRDTLHDMKQDFLYEVRARTGDHEAVESRATAASEPPARPELAFGLPPEDCLMVALMFCAGLVLATYASDALTIVLCLAGGIGLSGASFAFVKREKSNTYPPENPP